MSCFQTSRKKDANPNPENIKITKNKLKKKNFEKIHKIKKK